VENQNTLLVRRWWWLLFVSTLVRCSPLLSFSTSRRYTSARATVGRAITRPQLRVYLSQRLQTHAGYRRAARSEATMASWGWSRCQIQRASRADTQLMELRCRRRSSVDAGCNELARQLVLQSAGNAWPTATGFRQGSTKHQVKIKETKADISPRASSPTC
jgi:hypothetical protein